MTDITGYLSHAKPARLRRKKRATTEEDMRAALNCAAVLRWWHTGFQAHEPARSSAIEAKRLWAQGVKPGWPDCTLHIPARTTNETPMIGLKIRTTCRSTLAALELKTEKYRPKTEVQPEWWLDWLPTARQRERDLQHYGLRASQALQLQNLAACGYQTMVAYDWAEALGWLDKVAGPRPEVLPEGW